MLAPGEISRKETSCSKGSLQSGAIMGFIGVRTVLCVKKLRTYLECRKMNKYHTCVRGRAGELIVGESGMEGMRARGWSPYSGSAS